MQSTNILIIHQGAIGDLIVSLPSFHAIRSAFPEASIEVMGYPGILSLVNKRFYADAISSVNRAEVASLYNEPGSVNPYLIDYFWRFNKIFFFGGDAQKTAMQNMTLLHGVELYYVKTIPERSDKHVIDFQLEQINAHGYAAVTKIPRIYLLKEDIAETKKILTKQTSQVISQPFIAIHPGSGSSKKNWPVEHYAALALDLYRTFRGTILLIEGPADEQIAAQLKGELSDKCPVILQSPDLPVLAAILQECALFIGNDSGITHLAAAMNIPVVALFGPSDPHIWGPRGGKVQVLKSDVNEASGVQWIAPSAVFKIVLHMLPAEGPRRVLIR
jgi:ADP-heptose:LPS heptosyltransferase